MSKKDTFVLIDDSTVSNKFTFFSFVLLAFVLYNYISSTPASANQDTPNRGSSSYTSDMLCMGALSLARDITEHTDRNAFLKFTDIQNRYYLKYSGGISNDVATAKAAVLSAWKKNNAVLLMMVSECVTP